MKRAPEGARRCRSTSGLRKKKAAKRPRRKEGGRREEENPPGIAASVTGRLRGRNR